MYCVIYLYVEYIYIYTIYTVEYIYTYVHMLLSHSYIYIHIIKYTCMYTPNTLYTPHRHPREDTLKWRTCVCTREDTLLSEHMPHVGSRGIYICTQEDTLLANIGHI